MILLLLLFPTYKNGTIVLRCKKRGRLSNGKKGEKTMLKQLRVLSMIMLSVWIVGVMWVPSYALRIELSNSVFSPSGRGSNQNLFVTNNSDKILAVEIYSKKRAMKVSDGTDILTETEDFLIYPNQLLLQPGEQQVATITWGGEKAPDSELAYRLVVEQLNLDLGSEEDEDDGGVNVRLTALTKVVKAAYIRPSGAKPDILVEKASVKSYKFDGKKKTKNILEVLLSNQGTAHKIIKNSKLRVIPKDKKGKENQKAAVVIAPDQMRGSMNMLAKGKRRFLIPWPEDVPVGPVRVELE